jgi:hypothetical protein
MKVLHANGRKSFPLMKLSFVQGGFSHLRKKNLGIFYYIEKQQSLCACFLFFFFLVLNFSMKNFFLIILFVKDLLLQCFHIDNQSYLSGFQYFKNLIDRFNKMKV